MDYKADKDQIPLFDLPAEHEEHWQGMPSFEQQDLEPYRSLLIHFANPIDQANFADLIGQKITDSTRSLWYPQVTIGHYANKLFSTHSTVAPSYPVYIISKGRAESRLTVKALDKIRVPYRVVIEPQEFNQYAAVIPAEKLLVLPFSNLGQGSIPARNWVWDHSLSEGHDRHWILDDNIELFFRLTENLKTPVGSGAIFRSAEDFTDRYENVALSGFNYKMFAPRKSADIKPYTLNTRIYSCILIRNDLPFRWRGRYNEDTDLSLRILKAGHCTVLFNAFLAGKSQTMTMKGGNTDELYKDDGRLKMAQSLQEQHPDVVKITEKWGRPQHHVDYKQFRKNKLIPKPNLIIPQEIDNYGMELQVIEGGRK